MKKYQFLLLICSLLLHLVYFSYFFFQKTISKSYEYNEPQGYFTRLNTLESKKMPENAIVFIGNSLTEGYNWADSLQNPKIVNMGISGDNTVGVLKRLPKILEQKPSKIFIEIGVNDIRKFGLGYAVPNNITTDSIIQNIEKIAIFIKNNNPTCEIFINSLFPVIDNSTLACPKCPEVIPYINQQLANFAEKNQVTFIDSYSKMTNPQDNRLNEKFTYDGLHLNSSGYAVWRTELLKYL